MTKKITYESDALHRIHAKAATAKNECFFVGFLDGILANDRLDSTELEPLLAECDAICRLTRDDDAREIIVEASTAYKDTPENLLNLLTMIAEVRTTHIDPVCKRSSANRLLGFCAGVNCDAIITLREARRLYEKLSEDHELADDPRICALKHVLRDALENGALDPMEAEDISQLITHLVGDSYADTGIPSSESLPVIHDLDDVSPEVFEGSYVVLTGGFRFGSRRQVSSRLEEHGAIVKAAPSRKTNIVIIGSEGSPHYTFKHTGGKLAKALEMRSGGTAPRIYVEGQLGCIFA